MQPLCRFLGRNAIAVYRCRVSAGCTALDDCRLEAYKLIPCVCFNVVLVLRAPNNSSVVLQVLLVMQAPAYLNTAPMNAEVHVV